MDNKELIQPIVSVICPFYNAATTLERTIKSVNEQTYRQWEMILVNDGSTDGSRDIVMEYKRQYPNKNIRLLESDHSGPAKARNMGMDMAKGDYICFIDADDAYKLNMLETMVELITFTNADIAMCSFEKVYQDHVVPVTHELGDGALTEDAVINRFLRLYFDDEKKGVASLCNKIFKLSFINKNHLRLNTNMRRAEDWHFVLDCLLSCPVPSVAVTNNVLYSYIERGNSITHEVNPLSYSQSFVSTKRLLEINEKFNMHEEISVYSEIMGNSLTAVTRLLKMEDKAKAAACIKDIEQNEQFILALSNARHLTLPFHYKIVAYVWSLGWRALSMILLRVIGKLRGY